jgi:septal ring factor EnvC (AmiA/AmiB activator)
MQSVAGWEGVSSALREIRNCHADTWAFFHGLFEELNSFSVSLDAHKGQLVQSVTVENSMPQFDTSVFDERLGKLFSQRDEDREEIRETRETVREQVAHLAAVASELASVQTMFQTNFQLLREEISKRNEASALEASAAPSNSGATEDLERKLSDLERQHAALEQDRAVLEKELESVRSRAADLTESLSEQKRMAQQQQTQGAAELQRMRELLEDLARQEAFARHPHGNEPAPAEPPTIAVPKSDAPSAGDPVLGSVLAQFEMLQQDRAKRRA